MTVHDFEVIERDSLKVPLGRREDERDGSELLPSLRSGDCRPARAIEQIAHRDERAAQAVESIHVAADGAAVPKQQTERAGVRLHREPAERRSWAVLDLVCIVLSFLGVHAAHLDTLEFTSARTITLYSATALLIGFISLSGTYQKKRLSTLDSELTKVLVGWFCAFAAIGLVAFLSKTAGEVSRVWVTGSLLLSLILLLGVRVLRSTVLWRPTEQSFINVVVFGSASSVQQAVEAEAGKAASSVRVVAGYECAPMLEGGGACSEQWSAAVERMVHFIEMARNTPSAVEQVWISMPASDVSGIQKVSERLVDYPVDVCVVADPYTSRIIDGEVTRLGGCSVVNISEVSLAPSADQFKRAFDVVLGSVAIVLLAIPMALIACAVKLDSPGPIFFRQKRYGVDGKEIEVWKFRSMVVHSDTEAQQAKRDDARVTRVGKFLRRSSLDEVPQLFNVLQGTMSLVGPRPHAVAHNEIWRHKIRGYMLRHKVRPGITGWAQVNGWRGETDAAYKMFQRVQYDLDYIRNWSPLLDIKILFKTVTACLFDKNAF